MNNCEEFLEMISAYVDSELSASDKQRLEDHLIDCENCSAILSFYREISTSIEESSVPAPETLRTSVMERIQGDGTSGTDARKRRQKLVRTALTRYIPIAACLAIALLILPHFLSINRSTNDAAFSESEPDMPAEVAPAMAPVADPPAMEPNEYAFNNLPVEDDEDSWNAEFAITGASDSERPDEQDPADGRIHPDNPDDAGTDSYSPEPQPPAMPIIESEPQPEEESMEEPMGSPPSDTMEPMAGGGASGQPPLPNEPPPQPATDLAESGEISVAEADAPDVAQEVESAYFAYITIRGELPEYLSEIRFINNVAYIPRDMAVSLINDYGDSIEYSSGNRDAETAIVYFVPNA